jgi:type I restriction enzyme S subunit
VPPPDEQHRIVQDAERRLSSVAEAEATVDANLRRAGGLRQAILKHAFEGKLVPQDPTDEPASVLLERIRTEQATSNGIVRLPRRPVSRVKPPRGAVQEPLPYK